ncbi:DUF6679 family protein [Candidatus Cyanaurora vandensis]|uniref:DUF6679 family protein n=1 Tax=Candidatus Cyanaurora vandensis TaxID=2714958 RepID=UPI0025807712|nr:DUF6679 family protein [Candidatus Cyanaurora vandensis]
MLHRKIYQFSQDGGEVWIYLRDQGRWLERAKVLDIEGELVTVRYETEEEDEICAWEEMIRLDSIGSITRRLSSVPKGRMHMGDLLVSEDCPEAERMPERRGE